MDDNTFDTFLLNKLFNSSGIPVLIIKEDEENASISEKNKCIAYDQDSDFFRVIMDTAKKKNEPVIFMEEIKIFYGAFKDNHNRFFIWGPASLESLDKIQLVAYRHKHNISDANFAIQKSTYEVLSNIMAIAYFYYTGERIHEEEILIDWRNEDEKYIASPAEMERYHQEKSEMNRIHNSIEYENKYISAVEQGDITAMKKIMQINSLEVEGIGVVAESTTKQMEYLCVSSVLLVSRAAIRGGLNPELAYDLSDVYMQKIEKSKTIEEMAFVSTKMQLDYTERVHQAQCRKRGNIYVEKSKDYIINHLRKPFRVQEIAEALKVNRSYLSRIFKEQQGMTIQEYIVKERCIHAANMLKYTDYSIAVIAEYFCFSTQSHFGKQFRTIYSVTPREYRRENHYIESFYTKGE
ncbi:MAG: helix-turn-helix domain-containing protein [Lachnospiraceae bacterium]